jgi:hypothetical protein
MDYNKVANFSNVGPNIINSFNFMHQANKKTENSDVKICCFIKHYDSFHVFQDFCHELCINMTIKRNKMGGAL